ncbi:MAG TPA: hypothetical protein VGZ22_17680 [Isosphaeraceae bacterium]|jgi:hypothetical protein|nr:hypothetical protein [Isosphaeraceae bacterium]
MEAIHSFETMTTMAEPTRPRAGPSAIRLVELMLKDPARLHDLIRDDARQAELIPRFLAIAIVGFTIFGVAATVVLNAAGTWPPGVPASRWSDATAANLILAYVVGMIAATGVCLPSFYFYGLLAGLKISMLHVTTHAMKGMATSAVVLVGILPLYVAMALGMIVFQAPVSLLETTLYFGLGLPFVAGLWGVQSLYYGFLRLADTIPQECRFERSCFLRRLIMAWSGCYTVVTPVMIYTLWKQLAG